MNSLMGTVSRGDNEGKDEERGKKVGRLRSPGSNVKAFGFYFKCSENMEKSLTFHRGLDFFLFISVFWVTRDMPGMKVPNKICSE